MSATTDVPTKRRRNSRVPARVAVILWVIALIYVAFNFVIISLAAKAASGTASFPFTFLGAPVLEGFHHDGRFGVLVHPGIVIFLVVPFVVGVVLTIAYARRGKKTRD